MIKTKKKRVTRFLPKVKVETVRKIVHPADQETIIVYNKSDKQASLFTYQKALIRHMRKLGAKEEWENSHGGVSFLFPKNWCRKPLIPRNERE